MVSLRKLKNLSEKRELATKLYQKKIQRGAMSALQPNFSICSRKHSFSGSPNVKIAIPIREKSQKKAIKRAKLAQEKLHKMGFSDENGITEIWLDAIRDLHLSELLKALPKPFIAVCKTPREKGDFRGTEKARLDLLIKASRGGASYIDVSMDTDKKLLQNVMRTFLENRTKVILSFHDFSKTPSLSLLEKKVEKGFSLGADIVKIATFIKHPRENIILFELTQKITKKEKNIIVVGMGKHGKISRLGCAALGGFLTFVSFNNKSATAPNQLLFSDISNLNL